MNDDVFLLGYDLLKIPILDEAGRSNWPELYSENAIQKMKQSVGLRAFTAQMMLIPVSLEKIRLNPAALIHFDGNLEIEYSNMNTVFKIAEFPVSHYAFYWDPSSAKKGADGSVCVFLLFNRDEKQVFIRNVIYLSVDDKEVFPMQKQCSQVLEFMLKNKINVISVEVNGIGNALPEIIRQEAEARAMNISINKVVNHESKVSRILGAIEPRLSTGRLFIHKSLLKSLIIQEFKDFVPGEDGYDDAIDALAGAIMAVPCLLKAQRRQNVVYSAFNNFNV